MDFFLSQNRDVNAAKSFLRSAMKNARVPTKITLDAYAGSRLLMDVAQLEHIFYENPDQKETPHWDAISNQTEDEQILQFDLDLRAG